MYEWQWEGYNEVLGENVVPGQIIQRKSHIDLSVIAKFSAKQLSDLLPYSFQISSYGWKRFDTAGW